ncbi:MAG: LysR family transcriptional regulator [Pseudomonadota bacterium]
MDIKQRDLGLLLALDALLEKQSVSAAADRLGISQPAMSAQLRRLRELFNDPLLIQSGRRLVATSRALGLKEDLRRHLQDLDALVRTHGGFDPATAQKTFRIIGTDYAHAILTPVLAEQMAARAPHCRLAALPFAPKAMWQSLVSDEADLALVTGMKLDEAKMRAGIEESFCIVQRKGHPLGTDPLSLEAFCAAEHVLVSPEGGGFIGMADRMLAEQGYQRTVAISLPSFLLAPTLVAQTDYICLLPRRLAELHAHMVDLVEPPFETPTFRADLLWHARRQHDPAHIWFRDQVASVLGAAR